MKHHMLAFILFITCNQSFGQIQIKSKKDPDHSYMTEVKYGGHFHSQIICHFPDSGSSDTTYSLMFRNDRYTHIFETDFIGHTGKLSELYDLFANQIKGDDKSFISVRIGNDDINIHTYKSLGNKYIIIYKGRANFMLNEDTLKKLFTVKN